MENVGRRSQDWSQPGTPTDIGEKSLNGYERNVLFWNLGERGFEDAGYATGADRIEDGRGLAVADFDRDGHLDIAIDNNARPAVLLMGRGTETRHWVQFALEGTESNRDAVGARVFIETERGTQSATVAIGRGFLSSSSKIVHFGLGDADTLRRVTIRWPSGLVETLQDVKVDRRHTVREGDATSMVHRGE